VNRVPETITGDVARHYAASVMHLDDAVGTILAALDRTGRRNQTLVVFTSDNGGSTAENNDLKYPDDNCPTGRLPGNNQPWRGEKGSLYEGGTRVPTVVSWPGQIKPGAVDTPVQIIDWMPTFCALAGYQSNRDLKWDGVDLSALLVERRPLADRALYAVAPNERARSLRRGDWKLIVHGKGNAERVELFHLASDPAESRNVAPQQSERVTQLRSQLDDHTARDRDAVAK
jgi:arylsulfatase A-like enzyme